MHYRKIIYNLFEQLSELQEITYRVMMGEFIIYYRENCWLIYDDRCWKTNKVRNFLYANSYL